MRIGKLITTTALMLATCLIVPHVARADNLTDLAHFLDKSTPETARRDLFAAWRQAALAGDSDAQYIVGSIYRRGDAATPPVVERDLDQARRFLSTAAGHGRVLAMAKMAEVELADDHPLEAEIWTQIFGYYRGWVGEGKTTYYGEHPGDEPTIYFEDLLRRSTERARQKLGGQEDETVSAQLAAFVTAHDKDVRAGLWLQGIAPAWSGARLKAENAQSMRRVGVPGHRNMITEWVLDYGPDGAVKQALPFDAIPNFTLANGHHSLVEQYRFDPGSDADRYVLRTVDLRKAETYGPTRTR